MPIFILTFLFFRGAKYVAFPVAKYFVVFALGGKQTWKTDKEKGPAPPASEEVQTSDLLRILSTINNAKQESIPVEDFPKIEGSSRTHAANFSYRGQQPVSIEFKFSAVSTWLGLTRVKLLFGCLAG